ALESVLGSLLAVSQLTRGRDGAKPQAAIQENFHHRKTRRGEARLAPPTAHSHEGIRRLDPHRPPRPRVARPIAPAPRRAPPAAPRSGPAPARPQGAPRPRLHR